MQSCKSFHIVVTDINHHVRDFLQRELEEEGYAVSSIRTGAMACEWLFGSVPLDLIILDPQLFQDFDQRLVGEMVRQRPLLQIVIHAYADALNEFQPADHIHLVEKSGRSSAELKSIIRTCFTHSRVAKPPCLAYGDRSIEK
jgi:DNA-binding NtrC family response regulator